MIVLAHRHFDRGQMRLKFAMAAGEETPSLVNSLKRNLACAACEDDLYPYLGSNRYVRL